MKRFLAGLTAIGVALALVAPAASTGASVNPPYPFDPNYPTVTAVPNPVTPQKPFRAEARYFCPKVTVRFTLLNSGGTAMQTSKPITANSAGSASTQFYGVPAGTYLVRAAQVKPSSDALAKTCKVSITAYTTLLVEVDTTPPGPALNFDAVALSSSSIRLTWSAATGDPSKYRIERSANGSSGWSTIATINLPATLSYTNTGLSPATTYYYRIFAIDASGNESTPASDSAQTNPALGIVLNAYASVAAGKKVATLSWTGNTGRVDLFRTIGSTTTLIAKRVVAQQYTDRPPQTVTTATYRVCPTGLTPPNALCASATVTWGSPS